jgi:hypothetical protein
MDTNDSIWIYNCDILKEDLLFKRNIVQQGNTGHGVVSPSARYILVPIKKEKVTNIFFFELKNLLFFD